MPDEYALPGTPDFPQVEPEASYWFRCPVISTVRIDDVRVKVDGKLPAYPESNSTTAQQELNKLRKFFDDRDTPSAFPQSKLSDFLKNPKYTRRPPVGAVTSKRTSPTPFLRTGDELARLFQAETPGLWHRHVLNVLLAPDAELGRRLSPPRQALIWATLDVAISSALMAAWHYKWLATKKGGDDPLPRVAYRERPVEADKSLEVLYDYNVAFDGANNIVTGPKRTTDQPQPSPGTPRHPAYPSGHSTYAAAASYVLGCLLPTFKNDFSMLADDIGEARFWGGVHWETDHTAGQIIGRAVGELIIEQLNHTGISVKPQKEISPPDRDDLEDTADEFARDCGKEQGDFCGGADLLSEDIGFQNI